MIYYEKMSPMERLMSLAVRGELTQTEINELYEIYKSLGADAVSLSGKNNQVEALLIETLLRHIPPNEIEHSWQTLLRNNERRVLSLQDAWKAIAIRLNNRGCQHALVENAGVLYGSNMPIGAFCAGDFDILVNVECWEHVKQVFIEEGFQPADRRNRPTNRIEFCSHPSTGQRDLWLNAGWKAFDRMWVPIRYNEREHVWLSRTQPSRKDISLNVLKSEDSLAFVSMHTSLHSYIRAPGIRLHVDVDRLVRDNDINWDRYLEEIFAMNIQTRAFLSLSMASGLLGTPVPRKVLKQLYPGKLRCQYLLSMLQKESIFYNGKKKLKKVKSVGLDLLIHQGRALDWFFNIFFPDREWLIEHFDRENVLNGQILKLHERRFAALFRKWDPA